MFERFTDRARRVVVLAQEEARLLRHDYIGTEHILLGLIHEGEGVAAQALEGLDVSFDAVRAQVEELIGRGAQAPSGHIAFTDRAKKVLELSLREALQLGHNYIGTEHILLGLIREGDGVAAQVLVNLGADLESVRQEVIQLLSGSAGKSRIEAAPRLEYRRGEVVRTTRAVPHCSLCGRDLWEVSHYVDAGSAFVCAVCITDAYAALDAAGADERVLRMPARVFGTPPQDTSGALDEIAEVLKAVFGSTVVDATAAFLEDGAELVPILQAAADQHPEVDVADVVVDRVRFSEGSAEVAFALVFTTGGRVSFTGRLTRIDGRWVVSRQTMSYVLGTGGIALP